MNKIFFSKFTVAAFLLVFSLIIISKTIRHSTEQLRNTLKTQLKEEIQKELNEEIGQLVKQEMESYMASQQIAKEKKSATDITPVAQTSAIPAVFDVPTESKQKAIERIVKRIIHNELQELKESELDSYVASGAETETPLPTGGVKRQSYAQLAQADAKVKSGKSQESDLDVTAGEKKAESIERALVQRGGILLPRGKLQVEPSISYAHFSSNRITIQGFNILPVLVIGQIATETVKRDIFIETLGVKYGLWHNFQVDARVPWRWEHDRITDTFNNESTREASGMGDIEFGFSRQIGWEKGFIPDLLASVTVKTDTGKSPYNRDIGIGTGHWAVRGGVVAVKSSDPAVVFGGLNYTWNMERTISNFGTVDPGDTIGYTLGTAIALSYQTAINFSFDQSITSKLVKDKRTVDGSFLNVGNFKGGFTWAINEKSSIDFNIGIGLTKDAPDMTVEFRFPYTF